MGLQRGKPTGYEAGCLLTRRQADILAYIDERTRNGGQPPSYREIGARFGINSPNGVAAHLAALVKKGFLRRDAGPGGARAARTGRVICRRDGGRILIAGQWFEWIPADQLDADTKKEAANHEGEYQGERSDDDD